MYQTRVQQYLSFLLIKEGHITHNSQFSTQQLQRKFDVCMIVHHWYNNTNSQIDATITNFLLIITISSTCFGRKFRPSSGALDCVYSLWYNAPAMLPAGDKYEVELPVPPHLCHQQATSVLYTTSCKHSLVLLRMGEIFARNMLSWL